MKDAATCKLDDTSWASFLSEEGRASLKANGLDPGNSCPAIRAGHQ